MFCDKIFYCIQEIELDDRTNFAVITQRAAAPTVLQIVVSQAERELDNTDWVITRVRADAAADLTSKTGRYIGIQHTIKAFHLC